MKVIKLIAGMLSVVVLLACLLVIYVQRQNILNLEEMNVRGDLQEGATLPPLSGMNVAGAEQTIRYDVDARPTILYVFSPTCAWCARNADAINSLFRQLSRRYRFVGVSLDKNGLSEFLAAHHHDFSTVCEVPDMLRDAYRLGVTPETIVISSRGKVETSWKGAYTGTTKRLIQNYFSLELPSL
jgi:peroxiredoxin